MKINIIIFIYLLFFLCSCIKDKPQEPVKTAVSMNSDSKVLVINEGNYGWGNASVSLFDPSSNGVVEDYYKQQNNNAALGDVCQSITKYNSKYYIVVNTSSKIVVVDEHNFVKTATITGFNAPRYILPVSYNKAYVSDLYANSIHIVDLNSNTITGTIPCSGWTDEMALVYNKAFVTNLHSNYCYIINTITDVITDSVNIGLGGSSIVVDKNSKVWILTGGSSSGSQTGKLVRIDPVNLQVELNLSFSSTDSPNSLRINKTRDTLYYLNHGVNQTLITTSSLPANPLISQGSKLYYGLGVNPKDYRIYVCDAIDYVQKSKIEIYDVNGNFKSNFNAGIISNGFVFE